MTFDTCKPLKKYYQEVEWSSTWTTPLRSHTQKQKYYIDHDTNYTASEYDPHTQHPTLTMKSTRPEMTTAQAAKEVLEETSEYRSENANTPPNETTKLSEEELQDKIEGMITAIKDEFGMSPQLCASLILGDYSKVEFETEPSPEILTDT